MGIIFGILIVVVLLAVLWFWVRTLMVMNRESILWAVGGFFVSPIVQIIFFLTQKDGLNDDDSGIFKKFFIAMGVYFVVIILFTMLGGLSS